MSDEHGAGHGHDHGDHGDHGASQPDTTGGHGMLVFGEAPVYFSHLPMYMSPHNFQVLLEVQLDDAGAEALTASRAAEWDGVYTFDPVKFPIAELAPSDESEPLTTMQGHLVEGHFERSGRRIASSIVVEVAQVVYFDELDITAKPGEDDQLEYLAFGEPGRIFLAHRIRARPNFDHIVAARFVPGSVTNMAGNSFDQDDVNLMGYRTAQRVEFDGPDTSDNPLRPGDVRVGTFPFTSPPSGAHGFRVDIEVENELYLEVGELQ